LTTRSDKIWEKDGSTLRATDFELAVAGVLKNSWFSFIRFSIRDTYKILVLWIENGLKMRAFRSRNHTSYLSVWLGYTVAGEFWYRRIVDGERWCG
jgi:hypothetical protein